MGFPTRSFETMSIKERGKGRSQTTSTLVTPEACGFTKSMSQKGFTEFQKDLNSHKSKAVPEDCEKALQSEKPKILKSNDEG